MIPKSSSNEAKKIKKRSNSSNAADEYVPSPFELAQTAIALCRLPKEDHPGTFPQPENYFQQAKKLLAEAHSYLHSQIDWKEHAANVKDRLFSLLPANQIFTFDELLERSGEKGKKFLTLVYPINKETGLKKAIRRYFSKMEAAQMIKDRTMTGKQIKSLLEARKSAVEQRAARRVKGASSKKFST